MSSSVSVDAAGNSADARPGWSVALVCVALFLAAMDSTIVSTLLPTIVADLGGERFYAWLISGYIASGVVAAPFAGALADRYGAKPIMLLALVIFGAGMGLAYLAEGIIELVYARLLQGAGAGAIVVLSYALIGALYTAQERGKMQGMLSGIWGLSAIVGPVLGALLISFLSWREIFLAHVPLVFAVLVLFSALYRSPSSERSSSRFSVLANLAFAVTLLSLLALIQLPVLGLGAFLVPMMLVLVVSALVYLALVWRKPALEVLPRQFLFNKPLLASALLTVIAAATLYASVTLLPMALDQNRNAGVLDHGAVVFAAAMGWVLGSAICGSRLATLGYRQSALMGAVSLSVGTAGLAALPPTVGTGFLMVAQALIGVGIGFLATTGLVYAQNKSCAATLGRYTSAAQLFRNLGAALGVNAIAAIQLYFAAQGGATESYRDAFGFLMLLTLASLVFVFWLPRKGKHS